MLTFSLIFIVWGSILYTRFMFFNNWTEIHSFKIKGCFNYSYNFSSIRKLNSPFLERPPLKKNLKQAKTFTSTAVYRRVSEEKGVSAHLALLIWDETFQFKVWLIKTSVEVLLIAYQLKNYLSNHIYSL